MDENITVTLTPAQAWALVQEAQRGREAARLIYTDGAVNATRRELSAARWTALTEAISLITGIKQDLRLEPAGSPVHTVKGGKPASIYGGYGVTHDMDCPGCQDTSFTASPRSETYWSS
jgi:hypothetical protein